MSIIKLSPEAKKVKNAYQRQWSAKNRDKCKGYLRDYWERKAAQVTDTVTANLNVTTCLQCGKAFEPKRSDAKFCSDVCRVRYNRKHHK